MTGIFSSIGLPSISTLLNSSSLTPKRHSPMSSISSISSASSTSSTSSSTSSAQNDVDSEISTETLKYGEDYIFSRQSSCIDDSEEFFCDENYYSDSMDENDHLAFTQRALKGDVAAKDINSNIRGIYEDLHEFLEYFHESMGEIKSFLWYLKQDKQNTKNIFKFPQNKDLEDCVKKIGLTIEEKINNKELDFETCHPRFIREIEAFEKRNDIFREYFYYDYFLSSSRGQSDLDVFISVSKNNLQNIELFKGVINRVINQHKEEFEGTFRMEPVSSTINLIVEAIFGLCLMMGGFITLMNPIVSSVISTALLVSGISLFIARIRTGINVYLFREDEKRKKLAEKKFKRVQKKAKNIFRDLKAYSKNVKGFDARKQMCMFNLITKQQLDNGYQQSRQIDALDARIHQILSDRERANAQSLWFSGQHQGVPSSAYSREQARQYMSPHEYLGQPLNRAIPVGQYQGWPSAAYSREQARQYMSPHEYPGQPLNRAIPVGQYQGAPSAAYSREQVRQYMPQHEYPGQPLNRPVPVEQPQGMPPAVQPRHPARPLNAQHLAQSGRNNTQRVDQAGLSNEQRVGQTGSFNGQHVSQIDSFSRQQTTQSGENNTQQAHQAKLTSSSPATDENLSKPQLMASAELPIQQPKPQFKPQFRALSMSPTPPPTPRIGELASFAQALA